MNTNSLYQTTPLGKVASKTSETKHRVQEKFTIALNKLREASEKYFHQVGENTSKFRYKKDEIKLQHTKAVELQHRAHETAKELVHRAAEKGTSDVHRAKEVAVRINYQAKSTRDKVEADTLRGVAKDIVTKAKEQATTSKHLADEIGISLIHRADETATELCATDSHKQKSKI